MKMALSPVFQEAICSGLNSSTHSFTESVSSQPRLATSMPNKQHVITSTFIFAWGDRLTHQTRSPCHLCDCKAGDSTVSSAWPCKVSKQDWAVDGEDGEAWLTRALALCRGTPEATCNSPDPGQVFKCWENDCPKVPSPVS